MSEKLAVVILAGGEGKRMQSSLPKVLHLCAGLPLLEHVIRIAEGLKAQRVEVVVSPGIKEQCNFLVDRYPEQDIGFQVQDQPLGTGDALRVGLEGLKEFRGNVLVLMGDAPLFSKQTLSELIKLRKKHNLVFLSTRLGDPRGYGRVVRNENGCVAEIIEERDASATIRDIHEVNAGIYYASSELFRNGLKKLKTNNAQGEYYLTDIVPYAASGGRVGAFCVPNSDECLGVNSQEQLLMVERLYRARTIRKLQSRGVRFLDPQGTFIDTDVNIAKDAVIGVGVQLRAGTRIKVGAVIEGPTVLENTTVGPGAHVYPFTHSLGAVLEAGVSVGPFARLRPGTVLKRNSKVGNFVELKNTTLGREAKAGHLAYLGDAEIESSCNIGAGTITCNYDGINKHKTIMRKGAFVGSNSTLVAPVELGKKSYIAAGSVITKDVGEESLAFGRTRQVERANYARKYHKPKKFKG